jgi:amino acid transporter/mannitol/fructose-specific phosphotransferase system IIA component (Ntr-type)
VKQQETLKKHLKLWDVYALAAGAMFSSGLFLLPGLAAAVTGPSVVLAYFVSGLIVLPTMWSVAELATALPRSGGTYYIIDRSLGPMFGCIGGLGAWLALVLKSAFALIGMGAYLALFWDVNIVPVAVTLTVVLGLLNLFGAKETALLQKLLIFSLVAILLLYIVQGFLFVFSLDAEKIIQEQFTPFFTDGMYGFFATVGMVFVSYAGLTKVASVAEEVENPGRNIPLGMMLAIGTSVTVYVLGVLLMVTVLEPAAFREDLTPVATAGEQFLHWLPTPWGKVLVVIAAVAAFASTGNAGIMSASRYPMAMARDHLLFPWFSSVGKNGTPYTSVLATMGVMIIFLLGFNVSEVAKLASAFQLLLFGLLNVAVIVMRESQIEEYDPDFRSPLYPWMQIAGVLFSVILIFEMGVLPLVFTLGISFAAVAWYKFYAEKRVDRHGAIFHVHAELGKQKDEGLEKEMRGILGEKGLKEEDDYADLIRHAFILELPDATHHQEILEQAISKLSKKVAVSENDLLDQFKDEEQDGLIPITSGVVLSHARLEKETEPAMVIARVKKGLDASPLAVEEAEENSKVYAFFFLLSSQADSEQHIRILAHIGERVDKEDFLDQWCQADGEEALRTLLS